MMRFVAPMVLALGMAGARGEAPPTPAVVSSGTPGSTNSGPRIEFAEPIHEFGLVAAGDVLKYTYFFTNTGDQVLEVTNVHPSCGCTTAVEWTKRVEPGQAGTIPIQFNSSEFNGPVEKTVEVKSTAKSQPLVTLHFKGTVWRAIEVTPQFVALNYLSEAATNPWTLVNIVNNMEAPLILSPPECDHRAIAVELKTNEFGRSYQLYVSVKPPVIRNAQGLITVKTSSTNMPVIKLNAMVRQQAIVTFNPRQVILPAPPLANRLTNGVRIQNNGTNFVMLTEPTVNYTNVSVEIKNVVPGSTYVAVLVFPEGFALTPGEPMNLTVKTSHPLYPEIKVPVLQMARSAGQSAGPGIKPPGAPLRQVPAPAPASPGATKSISAASGDKPQ
jgi:hypothetical protein